MSGVKLLVALAALGAALSSTEGQNDGCAGLEVTIVDDWWRTRDTHARDVMAAQKLTSLNQLPCDNKMVGWYRFQLNGQDVNMSREPPKGEFYCGVIHPLWHLEGEPTPGHELAGATGCTYIGGNHCGLQWNMMVRDCGGYFIYQLDGTPYGKKDKPCGSSDTASSGYCVN